MSKAGRIRKMMLKAIAYLRVSTERQAGEERTSLADQRAAILQMAARLGVEVAEWFEDPGASGATVEGRPGLLALIDYCKRNRQPKDQKAYILILNASRWGRFENPEQDAYWRVLLEEQYGWVVRFAEGDAEGELAPVMRMMASIASSTLRKNIMANATKGKRGSGNLGFWTFGKTPLGFRRMVVIPEGSKRILEPGQAHGSGEKVKLTPYEEEARVVRWAFDRYASGAASLNVLLLELKQRWPARRWTHRQIGKMLANPVYLGHIVGASGGKRSDGERYGCENAHPALVTREIFDAVQERLKKNREVGRAAQGYYLMSGIMRCPICEHTYVGGGGGPSAAEKLDPAKKDQRRSYRDNGGMKKVCPGHLGIVVRHLIDGAIIDMMGETIGDPRVQRQIERSVQKACAAPQLAEGESQLRADLKKAQARLSHVLDAIAEEGVHELKARLEGERQRVARAEAALHQYLFRRSSQQTLQQEQDRLLQAAIDFPLAVRRTAPGAALKALIAPWIGSCFFDKHSRKLSLGISPLPGLGLLSGLSPEQRPQKKQQASPPLIVRTRLIQRAYG